MFGFGISGIKVIADALKLSERVVITYSQFHSGRIDYAWTREKNGCGKWLHYNKKIYPPQTPDEEPRSAFVCHVKRNIKYSPWKMWYIACLVRGLTVEEAVKQLTFINKKGAGIAKDTILEAQELAVSQHNVEYKTNLWVAESFVGKGHVVKGFRRHARARFGKVEYFHCHYFVRLEEGTPPEHYYYHTRPLTGSEMLDNWLQEMRNRRIFGGL
ncbi:39S ribosomal protein L22, mitochondrial [Gryllus bimaculatus]|nr:39S ribosomal protein L22, mitochondrial [Gryllus bimaculatus]